MPPTENGRDLTAVQTNPIQGHQSRLVRQSYVRHQLSRESIAACLPAGARDRTATVTSRYLLRGRRCLSPAPTNSCFPFPRRPSHASRNPSCEVGPTPAGRDIPKQAPPPITTAAEATAAAVAHSSGPAGNRPARGRPHAPGGPMLGCSVRWFGTPIGTPAGQIGRR